MRVKRPSLLLKLNPGSSLVYQVADALRDAIRELRLSAGDTLPSSRDLASQLGVARSTVLAAISQLVDEDLIETRLGAGTFIKTVPVRSPRSTIEQALPLELSPWALRLPDQTHLRRDSGKLLDLRPGLPDLDNLPFDEMRRSAMRKLRGSRARLASYGSSVGHADLRWQIAQYVARSRGLLCEADDVIVTNGAQQAFDLVARVLVRPGMTVAVEDPGYPPAMQAFAAAGADLCGVPVDEQGVDVTCLPGGATLVYTTPSHQFPLGVSLSDARRRDLLAWAYHHRALIIEDDYDSEYRFTSSALSALTGLDPDGRVVYVGTFSKSLMPGIRLGYVIAPRRLRRVLINAKCLVDVHSNNVPQAVLAEFMANGGFGRHLTKMRRLYAERHGILMQHGPAFRELGSVLLPSQGGLHACLLLPTHRREEDLIVAAAGMGVDLCGLRHFFVSDPRFSGLVIGFGNVDANRLKGALGQVLSIMVRDRD